MENDTSHLKESIVMDLKEMLDEYKPYAKNYRMIRDRLLKNGVTDVRLRIIGKRSHDRKRYI